MITAGIANDGVMMEPRLLLRATDAAGTNRYSFQPREYKTALTKKDADIVAAYMLEAVRIGTATRAAVPGVKALALL